VSRGQFAILGAVLSAIAVGIFIIAFESNVGLNGGSDIHQHSRGIFMLAGAGVGFVVFGLFGGPNRPTSPSSVGQAAPQAHKPPRPPKPRGPGEPPPLGQQ
jgi:hypothetical protein